MSLFLSFIHCDEGLAGYSVLPSEVLPNLLILLGCCGGSSFWSRGCSRSVLASMNPTAGQESLKDPIIRFELHCFIPLLSRVNEDLTI